MPAVLCVATGFVYLWLTPDDRHHAKTRKSKPAVRLTPWLDDLRVRAVHRDRDSAPGSVFNMLTIALPKMVDERHRRRHVPLVLVGSIATAVLLCGAMAQLTVGRAVECCPPHMLFAVVTGLASSAMVWAAYADRLTLMIALAFAIAAIYGQVTVNDLVIARYTADAWRGRVYAVRYFIAVHQRGRRDRHDLAPAQPRRLLSGARRQCRDRAGLVHRRTLAVVVAASTASSAIAGRRRSRRNSSA